MILVAIPIVPKRFRKFRLFAEINAFKMPQDYKQEVIADYHKKKIAGKLSPSMAKPTPAGLKAECLLIYKEKDYPLDDLTLRSFLGSPGAYPNYIQPIENADIDKFKPLVNFIKGKTSSPGPVVVNLLAWLIGFDHSTDAPISSTEEIKIQPRPHYIKSFVFVWVILLILTGASYTIWKQYVDSIGKVSADEQCMVWTGNHYEPVNCKAQNMLAPIVPLNENNLRQFKKIGWPDTLTKHSIGHVWYTKIKGKHEYFTASGVHPIDTLRQLRPISNYIITRYSSYHRYLLTLMSTILLVVLSSSFIALLIVYLWRRYKPGVLMRFLK